MFVGGLSRDTTEDDIKSYFNKYGSIVDVTMKYDTVTGNSRGFAFVTFADDAIGRVLSNFPHTLNNRVIVPKRANSRSMHKKIFVGGVDSNTREEDLKDHFSQFGRVKDIEFPFDHQRCRRRQFCFVVFDSESSANAACRESKQRVCGRSCDIQKAQSQPIQHQQRRPYFVPQNSYKYTSVRGHRSHEYSGNDVSGHRVGHSRRESRRGFAEDRESTGRSSRSYYSSADEGSLQTRRRYRDTLF